jgi:hypothetical protein
MCRSVSFLLSLVFAFGLAATPLQLAAAPVRSHAHGRAHAQRAVKATSKTGSRVNSSTTRNSRARSRTASRTSAHGRVRPAVSSREKLVAQPSWTASHAHQTRRAMRGRRFRTLPNPEPRLQSVHLAMPPPLRGSHESLVHQNEMAEADGLERILDDADLQDRINHGSLVRIPASVSLRVNTDLPENRRYCRPWTAKFLTDLSQAHSAKFASTSIEVTSAVRTVEYQRRLRMINGNAAAADGDVASPHLTGGTIDIAKQGMSAREIGWLRAWLIPLEQAGKIDVEEEFRQSCFHISVYRSYTDKVTPASKPLAAGTMLAARGR